MSAYLQEYRRHILSLPTHVLQRRAEDKAAHAWSGMGAHGGHDGPSRAAHSVHDGEQACSFAGDPEIQFDLMLDHPLRVDPRSTAAAATTTTTTTDYNSKDSSSSGTATQQQQQEQHQQQQQQPKHAATMTLLEVLAHTHAAREQLQTLARIVRCDLSQTGDDAYSPATHALPGGQPLLSQVRHMDTQTDRHRHRHTDTDPSAMDVHGAATRCPVLTLRKVVLPSHMLGADIVCAAPITQY
eukprot:1698746-Rhodomonas_salina.1